MKKTSIYLAAGAIALTSALTACDNDFATPPAILPPAYEIEGNTPLLDIKTDNWQYLGGHYEMPYGETGDTIIFTGRVCSSDASGNMTRSLIVQSKDKDGNQIAINFSIQDYTLSNIFPYGQEVAVYASGMTIGGYHNLLQFGTWDATKGEMTFMSLDDAKKHIVRNHVGLPEPSKVDTTATTLTEIIAAKADQTQLMLWQSRLVRVEGVSFEDAGLPFAEGGYTERYITDGNGNRLNVRNNNRASFANDIIPGGTGSVTGILSYYNSDWQLMLLDVDGLKGFTPVEPIAPAEPTGEGTLESPYNVAKALEIIQSGSMTEDNVYVKGIIRSIKEIDTSNYGNATYDITDNGSNTFTIYRGKWLDNEKFTKPDQLAVGAEVVVLGKLIKYNSTPEMAQGNYIISYDGTTGGGGTPTPPEPSGDMVVCEKATSITSGDSYVLVVDNQYGAVIDELYNGKPNTFGRLSLKDFTLADGKFEVGAANAIVITEVSGKGYTLVDSFGRYLSMDDPSLNHLTSFQLYTEPQDGSYWTAAFEDGKVKFTNCLSTSCFVAVSQGSEGTYYSNIAPANSPAVFKLPELYKATPKQ